MGSAASQSNHFPVGWLCNEVSNLRHICDQIFGEENFVEQFTWKKSYGGGPKEKYAVTQHEYILLYARNLDELANFDLNYDPAKVIRYYKHKDEHFEIRGPFRLKPLEATKSMDDRPNLIFPIKDGDGDEIWPKRQWLWSRDRVEMEQRKGGLLIINGSDGRTVNYKQYLRDDEGIERGEKPFSVIDGIYTQRGTEALRTLFDGEVVVQFPKPPELIELLARIALEGQSSEPATVLDFFAGSATTWDAVCQMALKAGKQIKTISVQLPEPCDVGAVASKAGFKTIADIAKERIRRAGSKIRSEWEEKNTSREGAKARSEEKEGGGGDLFSDPKKLRGFAPPRESSEPSSSPPDTGFRVFKLAPSNFKRWDGEAAAVSTEALAHQLEANLDHIATGATEESILFEILLKAGYQLTCPIEKLSLAGHTVYAIDGLSLFICVENRIDNALIDAVAEKHPVQFICLDRALQGNDSLKVNTLETFRSAQPEIQFRTV